MSSYTALGPAPAIVTAESKLSTLADRLEKVVQTGDPGAIAEELEYLKKTISTDGELNSIPTIAKLVTESNPTTEMPSIPQFRNQALSDSMRSNYYSGVIKRLRDAVNANGGRRRTRRRGSRKTRKPRKTRRGGDESTSPSAALAKALEARRAAAAAPAEAAAKRWVRGGPVMPLPPGWKGAKVPRPGDTRLEVVAPPGFAGPLPPPGVNQDADGKYYVEMKNEYKGGKKTLRKLPKGLRGFAVRRICATMVIPIGTRKKGLAKK